MHDVPVLTFEATVGDSAADQIRRPFDTLKQGPDAADETGLTRTRDVGQALWLLAGEGQQTVKLHEFPIGADSAIVPGITRVFRNPTPSCCVATQADSVPTEPGGAVVQSSSPN